MMGGSQLKWVVDKSKRNAKAMNRQLEGNPYSRLLVQAISCTGAYGDGYERRLAQG
jgi:hypothetical protein